MAKFTKAEARKSLLEGITLVERGNEFLWLFYDDLEGAIDNGFQIVSEEKAELFKNIK